MKVSDFKTQIRGGAGIRGIKFNSGDSLAAFALIGKTDDDSIEEAIMRGSQLRREQISMREHTEMGRYAKGGTLMKLKKKTIKKFCRDSGSHRGIGRHIFVVTNGFNLIIIMIIII